MTESKSQTCTYPFLKDIVKNVLTVKTVFDEYIKYLSTTEKGLQAANLLALRDLAIYYDNLPIDVRDKVRVSFTKELPTVVTSVSSACALAYFRVNPEAAEVIFLNCGTGSVKFQYYYMKNGVMVASKNFDCKDTAGVSMNTLLVPNVPYDKKGIVSADTIAIGLGANIAEFKKTRKLNLSDIPIFMFVTGTIRNYADDHPETASLIEKEIQNVFAHQDVSNYKVSAWNGVTTLMSQDAEAYNEFISIAHIVRSENPMCKLILTKGVGRGSAQGMVAIGPNPETNRLHVRSMEHSFGMNDIPNLMEDYKNTLAFIADKSAFNAFIKTARTSDYPTIGLKSGCLLSFEPPKGVTGNDYAGFKARQILFNASPCEVDGQK